MASYFLKHIVSLTIYIHLNNTHVLFSTKDILEGFLSKLTKHFISILSCSSSFSPFSSSASLLIHKKIYIQKITKIVEPFLFVKAIILLLFRTKGRALTSKSARSSQADCRSDSMLWSSWRLSKYVRGYGFLELWSQKISIRSNWWLAFRFCKAFFSKFVLFLNIVI